MNDPQSQMVMRELVRRSNMETQRLRELEDRVKAMEDRVNAVEASLVSKSKNLTEKLTGMDSRIKSMEDELVKLHTALERVGKQTDKFVTRRELKEIEQMFDLLSPVRNEYVTREELRQ